LAIYIDAFYYRLSIYLGMLNASLSSLVKACASADEGSKKTICDGSASVIPDMKKRIKELSFVVRSSRQRIYKRFKSDFDTLKKNYEESWRFVMNTLKSYGLEKSYNFSSSVE